MINEQNSRCPGNQHTPQKKWCRILREENRDRLMKTDAGRWWGRFKIAWRWIELHGRCQMMPEKIWRYQTMPEKNWRKWNAAVDARKNLVISESWENTRWCQKILMIPETPYAEHQKAAEKKYHSKRGDSQQNLHRRTHQNFTHFDTMFKHRNQREEEEGNNHKHTQYLCENLRNS